jgi:hypothetical protein
MKTCWRCKGRYEVEVGGEMTVCGACLGSSIPAKPCPECGSEEVKILTDGSGNCWRCRKCGFEGEWCLKDTAAFEAWQNIPRK